jgi:hypothetical protein
MCSALLFLEISGSREVRLLAIFLKHFESSYITGIERVVDGGMTPDLTSSYP